CPLCAMTSVRWCQLPLCRTGEYDNHHPQKANAAIMSYNLETLLSRVPALAGAPQELIKHLAQAGVVRTFSRDEYVWRAGDLSAGLCIVRSGVVKIARVGQGGRTMVCGFFGPGDSIGELALLRRIPYPAEASILTPKAVIVYLPAALVMGYLERTP